MRYHLLQEQPDRIARLESARGQHAGGDQDSNNFTSRCDQPCQSPDLRKIRAFISFGNAIMTATAWNWTSPAWPRLTCDLVQLAGPLSRARAKSGRLCGMTAVIGAQELALVQRDVWFGEAVATAAIEGEIFDLANVRSSVAHSSIGSTEPAPRLSTASCVQTSRTSGSKVFIRSRTATAGSAGPSSTWRSLRTRGWLRGCTAFRPNCVVARRRTTRRSRTCSLIRVRRAPL